MTTEEIKTLMRFFYGINKAIKITHQGTDLKIGDDILIAAKEASAIFQSVCNEIEAEYKKKQSPSQEEIELYQEMLKLKADHFS